MLRRIMPIAGLLAATSLAACSGLGKLAGLPGTAASSGPPEPFTLTIGPAAASPDPALETYDTRRAFWVAVGDTWPEPTAAEFRFEPPPGARPPSQPTKPLYLPTTRTYRVKARFYDPGDKYKLVISWTGKEGKPEAKTFELPEVAPMTRKWGDVSLAFTADPSLGQASQSATLHLRVRDAAGSPAAVPARPRFLFTDACGWLSAGTFSADPAVPGHFSVTTLAGDMANSGDYRLRIYPQSDQATWVDFTYEAL